MSVNAKIVADMEAIINDGFFSETIVHSYPTAATENLTVIWNHPGSGGINDQFESELPSFYMKTSAMGNITKANSRFTRDSITYLILEIGPDESGITQIFVSETDS